MSMDPDPTRAAREPSTPPAYEAPSAYPTAGDATVAQPSGPAPAGATNGFAVASLVLGIVGLTAFPLIPSVIALVLGYKAKADIDRSGGVEQGRGLAVAGIALGWIAIAMAIAVVAFFAITAIGLGVFSEFGP